MPSGCRAFTARFPSCRARSPQPALSRSQPPEIPIAPSLQEDEDTKAARHRRRTPRCLIMAPTRELALQASQPPCAQPAAIPPHARCPTPLTPPQPSLLPRRSSARSSPPRRRSPCAASTAGPPSAPRRLPSAAAWTLSSAPPAASSTWRAAPLTPHRPMHTLLRPSPAFLHRTPLLRLPPIPPPSPPLQTLPAPPPNDTAPQRRPLTTTPSFSTVPNPPNLFADDPRQPSVRLDPPRHPRRG